MATVRDLSDILNGDGPPEDDSKRPASFIEKAIREQNKQATDPSRDITGSAPNFGKFPMPHVMSFGGMAGSYSKVYRSSDEAIRDSRDNARFMRNDCGIMECIEARQRCTALLDWHLEPEDENSPEQVALVDELTKILNRMNRFTEYRFNLLHAIWYGRYAIQHRYRWTDVGGRMRVLPAPFRDNPGWMPINGDKLVFRYDDGGGNTKPDQVGIRVGSHMMGADRVSGRWDVEPTHDGMAYFLKDWERPLLAIHKHTIEDGAYEHVQDGGMIHGVGVRSRIYWDWFQKQECLAFLMEYLERSAGGIEIWYYPQGNAEAEAKARTAAEERIANQRNIVLVPKPMGDDAHAFGVEVIEPGMGGIDALQNILNEYYGHRIKRYILGQTLSSEAQATGLGSGLADLHLDTFLQIIKYDSINLEETVTHQLVKQIKEWNFPAAKDIHVDFKIDVEQQDVGEKLSAWQMAWQMGAKLKENDVMELIGAAMPTEQDRVLEQPEDPGMGGMGGGMFPGMDPMAEQQTPPQGGVEQMDRVDDAPPPPPDVDRDTDSVLRDLFGEASVDGQTVTYVTSDGKWVQKEIPFDTGDRKRADKKIVSRHSKWTSEDEAKVNRGGDPDNPGRFSEKSGGDKPLWEDGPSPKFAEKDADTGQHEEIPHPVTHMGMSRYMGLADLLNKARKEYERWHEHESRMNWYKEAGTGEIGKKAVAHVNREFGKRDLRRAILAQKAVLQGRDFSKGGNVSRADLKRHWLEHNDQPENSYTSDEIKSGWQYNSLKELKADLKEMHSQALWDIRHNAREYGITGHVRSNGRSLKFWHGGDNGDFHTEQWNGTLKQVREYLESGDNFTSVKEPVTSVDIEFEFEEQFLRKWDTHSELLPGHGESVELWKAPERPESKPDTATEPDTSDAFTSKMEEKYGDDFYDKWTSEEQDTYADLRLKEEESEDSGREVTPKVDVTRQHIAEMHKRLKTKGLASKIARRGPGEGGSVNLTLEEVDDLLKHGIIGLMSAGKNPNLEPDMSVDEEKSRHDDLVSDLRERGFMFTEGRGMYEGHEEPSVMVMIPESSRSEMVELGETYNQDSVIWSDGGNNHFVYTTGDNAGQSHTGNGFDYRKDASDYFTEFCEEGGENCSKFLLEFDFDKMSQAKYERASAEWVEEDHPRADDGKFTSKGSGGWKRRQETVRKEKDPSKTSVAETPFQRRKRQKSKPVKGGDSWVMMWGEEGEGAYVKKLGPASVRKSLAGKRQLAFDVGVDMTKGQKAAISKVVSKLTNRLSTRAARRLEKHTKQFHFHDSTDAMLHASGMSDLPFWGKQTPMALHDKDTFSVHFSSPDSYPDHPTLTKPALTAHSYAYALASAMDGGAGHHLSKEDEWQEAWEAELSSDELTDFASTDAKVGFAEFGRMVIMRKLTPKMRKAFPRCVKFFERQELIKK